jgi:hypothetical protein
MFRQSPAKYPERVKLKGWEQGVLCPYLPTSQELIIIARNI